MAKNELNRLLERLAGSGARTAGVGPGLRLELAGRRPEKGEPGRPNPEAAGLLLAQITGGAAPAGGGQIEKLNRQLAGLTNAARRQTQTTEANTRAVIENSLVRAAGGRRATAGSIARTVLSFLGGGLGLVSLIGKLFGGGRPKPQPAPAAFSLPPQLQVDAGILGASPGLHPIRYAQDGLPRTVPAQPAANVTVQVQAMDSRSFLDHSTEIAQAVREALLNSHALGDVVTEL